MGYCKICNNPKPYVLSFVVVRETGLEPVQESSHYPLKVARLPIPPLSQILGQN